MEPNSPAGRPMPMSGHPPVRAAARCIRLALAALAAVGLIASCSPASDIVEADIPPLPIGIAESVLVPDVLPPGWEVTAVRPATQAGQPRRRDARTLLLTGTRAPGLSPFTSAVLIGTAWEVTIDGIRRDDPVIDAGRFADPELDPPQLYVGAGGLVIYQRASQDRIGRFIASYGLSEDRALDLADAVRVDEDGYPSLPESAVPAGLDVVGSGLGPFSHPREHSVEFRRGEDVVRLDVVEADPRVHDLWSFWLDQPAELEVSTGRGRIGTSRWADQGNVLIWSGQSTAVLRGQVGRLDLVELANSLIAAPRDALDPLMIGVLAAATPCDPDYTLLGGILPAAVPARWAACFLGSSDGTFATFRFGVILPAGNRAAGITSNVDLNPSGQLTWQEFAAEVGSGPTDPRSGRFVAGAAPPGADVIIVSAAGIAIPLEVELSAPADPSGRRWFAAYLRGPDARTPDLEVTALDAAGQVIDRRGPETR